MNNILTIPTEIRHMHYFCGLGGGAKGFNMGQARVGALESRSRCIGGIDVDPAAIRDFDRASGVRGTVLDLFDRDQYKAFNGQEPPPEWREATTADVIRAGNGERPHIIFLSAPCKGFSGLLPEARSATTKYQALNRLTLRGIWLSLEAYKDDPVELYVFENVPRILARGKHLLDQIVALLRDYGYAVAMTTHDCGELGGLSQSRKRFLLVARHTQKVPPFLYEPEKKRLQSVGTLLDRMPLPGDPKGGPMHRVPQLQWATWVRLAFVQAGADWRSLQKLRVENGVLTDFAIVPAGTPHRDYLGVRKWEEPSRALSGRSLPTNGAYAVADPRYHGQEYSQYGVIRWADSMGAISAQSMPGGGRYAIADPRHRGPAKHSNEYRIVGWPECGQAVTSAHGTGQCVADPRPNWSDAAHGSKLAVMAYEQSAHTVTGARFGSGGLCVADPRTNEWVSSDDALDYSPLPAARDHLVARITALDGTWHRPFTTLECAVLQSLVEPEEYLELDGLSDQAWRERIGNAVPPLAAKAVAEVMFTTLLLAWSGRTQTLSKQPIWVRSVATALSVSQPV